MKYQRSTKLGCKDIEVRKSEFVAKNQFLSSYIPPPLKFCCTKNALTKVIFELDFYDKVLKEKKKYITQKVLNFMTLNCIILPCIEIYLLYILHIENDSNAFKLH